MMRRIDTGLLIKAGIAYLLCFWLNSCVSLPDPLVAPSIPPRQKEALNGYEFCLKIQSLDEGGREDAILSEFRLGNVPEFLRELLPLRYFALNRLGKRQEVIVWATKDYLSLGNDENFVRIPMSPVTAQKIADSYGLMLPTARLVDEIYRAASLQLAPYPFRPGPQMVSVAEFFRHDRIIQKQLEGDLPEGLVAGHKKDIVLSQGLEKKADRVAIYGWHQRGGLPIQPLSTVHGVWYADYSHGIRLLSNILLIDRQTYSLAQVLSDPNLAPLVSYEGPLRLSRYRTEGVDLRKSWWPKIR